jgi:hypothetical protein
MDNVAATFAMSVKLGNKQFVERLTLDFDPTNGRAESSEVKPALNSNTSGPNNTASGYREVGCLFKFLASRDFPTRAMRQGFRASSAG